jgi:hypothetical protein
MRSNSEGIHKSINDRKRKGKFEMSQRDADEAERVCDTRIPFEAQRTEITAELHTTHGPTSQIHKALVPTSPMTRTVIIF